MDSLKFHPHLHKKYFLRVLEGLPHHHAPIDTHRVVMLYFCLAGLDILNELHCLSDEKKKSIIEWVYSLQVVDDEDLVSGFQGSTICNTEFNRNRNSLYKWGHLATTYSALCSLVILGDDLDRVHRDSIINSLRTLQLASGCYTGARDGTESDMRFVYCAACISYILNDFCGMDIEKTVAFIKNSMSYDFGIAQEPELESHSGSTFCAVATLALTQQLHRLSKKQRQGLTRWLLFRLERFGFAGRPNKPEDTCYSFWTGGALKILKAYQFIDDKNNNQFVLATQDTYGGFSKWVNTHPDPMHTYLGLSGLSFMGEQGLCDIFPQINITNRAHEHLLKLHEKWKQ